MKKLLSFVLIISMVFSIGSMSGSAIEIENQPIQEMDIVQQEIEAILAELNEMAAEEKMAAYLAVESSELADKLAALKAQNDQRKQTLEARLDTLGVNTIDPNDPEDMAALEEVMHGNGDASVQSSDPPDLAVLAGAYTLRQYNGNTVINNTLYRYSYIYVTDDKNYAYSPLTQSKTVDLIGEERTVLGDVLDFQFSFAFSAYLGTIPFAWAGEWLVGTALPLLEEYDENLQVVFTQDDQDNAKSIYTMQMMSITQMMYTYVRLPSMDEWYLCGSRASNIQLGRSETFLANIGGNIVNEPIAYPTQISSTGTSAIPYVQAYVQNMYHDIDYIGSFTVYSHDGTGTVFYPGFSAYPSGLVGLPQED